MDRAQQLFVIYGAVVLVVGFGLGTILGALRMKSPDIRSLATAHVETLMQSSMHFGLAFAFGAVGFASGWATAAAWLLVGGSAMQAIGVTLNWLTRTRDQFADRSPGFIINAASTYVMLPGVGIAAVGILVNV